MPPRSPHLRPSAYNFGVVGSKGKIATLEHSQPTEVQGIRGTVVEVATSNSDGYALTSSGSVWAWGAGAAGELGNGTTPTDVTRAVRVDFPSGVRITSLGNPMPFDAALAVDSTGQPWGWGLDAAGDLCGAVGVDPRPVRIPLTHVMLTTGAKTHALFDSAGRLYACGSGEGGALGTGSTAAVSMPTPVQGLPAAKITALTSSWEGSGALFANGAYYDWGYNASGQLGNGSTTDSDLPVAVRLPATVRQVFQGEAAPTTARPLPSCRTVRSGPGATTTGGSSVTVRGWSSDVPVPVDVPVGVTFNQVASGGFSTYAIDHAGRLWAWGGNENGQLGTVAARNRARPDEVGLSLTQISSTANNVVGFERAR